jgi:Tfp pilus assembly pilus retraction ATPase PilT
VITGENGAGKKAFAATIIDHIDDVTSHRYLTKIP